VPYKVKQIGGSTIQREAEGGNTIQREAGAVHARWQRRDSIVPSKVDEGYRARERGEAR
jgi:hypothetical protein